jgi:hypothetical protein
VLCGGSQAEADEESGGDWCLSDKAIPVSVLERPALSLPVQQKENKKKSVLLKSASLLDAAILLATLPYCQSCLQLILTTVLERKDRFDARVDVLEKTGKRCLAFNANILPCAE